MSQKLLLSIVLLLTTLCFACTSSYIDKDVITNRIPLKVAAVCMNAVQDKKVNLQKFFHYMEEASLKGAKLIVFPEIALQQNPAWGFDYQPTQEELDYIYLSAETIPGESTGKLIEKAKELNIYVMFGMTEKEPHSDVLYNSCVLLAPNGIIGKHRKRNLWDNKQSGNEHVYWTPSKELGVIDSPFGKIGIMICGNMFYNFPESTGGAVTGPVLAEKGADLLVTITAWPSPMAYDDATVRNASEAKRWHVVSNQVGAVGHTIGYGHSRIIDPDGNIVADTDLNEGMVVAETNLMVDIP